MGNKIPSSWFDDPEWEMLRRKAEKRPISKHLKQQVAAQKPQPKLGEKSGARTEKQTTEKEVTVNLKFTLPKLRFSDLKLLYRSHRRQILLAGGTLVTIILVFGALKFISARKQAEKAKKPVSPEEQAQATFNPLKPLDNLTDPSGKEVLGPEFRYDQEKKVLGYTTDYNGAHMTVSQQALPDQLKNNPGQLEGIARSVSANVPIETQKGRAYIATNDKTKEQIAVFATKEVLVFLRSNKTLDNDEWIFYINQLNPSR